MANKTYKKRVPKRVLDDAVRRMVEAVHPRRIILFGSAARGEMGPHSDLDFLVVMPDGVNRLRAAQDLYRSLYGLEYPKDIVVALENDIALYGDEYSLVYHTALTQGKELYHAA